MKLDPRFKPWAKETGKAVGVTSAVAAATVLSYEIGQAYFAAQPLAQIAIYGLTLLVGVLAKSPYFKGGK